MIGKQIFSLCLLNLFLIFGSIPFSAFADTEFPSFCSRLLSTPEKIEVRGKLTKIFEPIGRHLESSKDSSEEEILKWFQDHPEAIIYSTFQPRSHKYSGNPPISTLTGLQGYQFHGQFFEHRLNVNSGHAHSFYVSSVERSRPFLTKIILSLKYLANFSRPSLPTVFSAEESETLKKYSFTKLEMIDTMEFAFFSYAQAISLLSVDRPLEISDQEWLKILLLPQQDSKFSLVEQLAVVLKPAVLGYYSIYGMYVPKPLDFKNGKWVFSQDFKIFFRESQENWKNRSESKTTLIPGFEMGSGCPAAFCGDEDVSSLRRISEALIHVFKVVDQNCSHFQIEE